MNAALQSAYRKAVPVGVIFGLAYLNYASMYRLGYHEIWMHHRHSVAVSMWAVLGVCQALVFFYWALMLLNGPGTAPKSPPYDIYGSGAADLAKVPPVYVCDEYGFPLWCSNCGSVKAARVSHSSHYNKCIVRFDHYCLWVGTVIGQANTRPFLKFMWWFWWYFVAMLAYLARYTRSNIARGLDHNLIVLYVMCGWWILMISPLFGSHVWYLVHNQTTLDDMNAKRAKRERRRKDSDQKNLDSNSKNLESNLKFVSVAHHDFRLVVPHTLNPFDFGFRKHWTNTFVYNNSTEFYEPAYYSNAQFAKAFVIFLVPLIDVFFRKPEADGAVFGPQFLEAIQEKIEAKRCYIPSYVRVRPQPEGQPESEQEKTPETQDSSQGPEKTPRHSEGAAAPSDT